MQERKSIKKQGMYIPTIEAKDIYLSAHCAGQQAKEYTLKREDGEYNLKKFTHRLDYSLDLTALLDIYHKKYRRQDFSFCVKNLSYTAEVINVTFRYSVKEWNQMGRSTFIRFGCDPGHLDFRDCIARDSEGEIAGIQLGCPPLSPVRDLPSCFEASDTGYRLVKSPATLLNTAGLRTELYADGFLGDGVRYCRMKRSSGSARQGKCLFVDEKLYKPLLRFSSGGIMVQKGQELELAAYESYISLPSSSIIGTLPIRPENILLIDDYQSVFQEDVVATHARDGHLVTSEQRCEISNSIWDGQSLIDVSLMEEYASCGMVLLRNLMFKSCCFNCNIQKWFQDNRITELSQLNGRTRASRIEDIRLITTPSSVKYLKFDTWDHWLDHLYPDFGVVKHDKQTPFFGGRLVQTHYQLLNTLQLTEDEMRIFLRESLEFARLLRDNPAVVRHYVKCPLPSAPDLLAHPAMSKNEVVYNLLCVNDAFTETRYYRDFLMDLLRSYYKNLKKGHVFVNGNYSTLLGNPVEMLQQAIGKFDGVSQLGVGNIHSTRFACDQLLLGSRSPHVTMGNIWLARNRKSPFIDRYCNLTDEIVCVNSIGENLLQRLSGADFDSDTVLLTDNETLIGAARRNYHVFKTPTSLVTARKVKRRYTPEDQADLDQKTSVNKIGEIINLSQELNSLLWDRMYHGESYGEVRELYHDICQLDILSGIEIDKAKKEFDIDVSGELRALRRKYDCSFREDDGRRKTPHFFSHISRQKGYYNPEKRHYVKFHTSMDYLQTIVNGFCVKNPYRRDWQPFSSILNRSLFRTSGVNREQLDRIYGMLHRYIAEKNGIYGSDSTKEEKNEQAGLLYHSLFYDLGQEKIGFSTLYKLLSSLEDTENLPVRSLLLQTLFLCKNESFRKAILDSSADIQWLTPGGEDVSLFGKNYKITKKGLHSEI